MTLDRGWMAEVVEDVCRVTDLPVVPEASPPA